MIINQTYGFTFIHIPKSAGTSVTRYLSPLNGPFDLEIGGTVFGEEIQPAYARRYKLRKHSTLNEIQSAMRFVHEPRAMFTFAFVRNPYSRLASAFSFLRKWEQYDPKLLHIMRSYENFQEFVESGLFTKIPGPDGMFKPQCNWLRVSNVDPIDIKIFKIEEITSAIIEIQQELAKRGADVSLLDDKFPHSNKSQGDNNSAHSLPDNLAALIANYYIDDFNQLKYRT